MSLLAVQVLGWRVYWCSVTLPQGKNSAGRVTICCYGIVGLARRLSFLQIHLLCGEHPYTGLMVISTNFLCWKKTDHLMCGWRIPMSLMPTRFGWVLSPWAPLDDPSILHIELVIPLSTSLSLAIQLVRVWQNKHIQRALMKNSFPHLNMNSNWVWSNWVLTLRRWLVVLCNFVDYKSKFTVCLNLTVMLFWLVGGCSEFCTHCTRWSPCVLPILLSSQFMHWSMADPSE